VYKNTGLISRSQKREAPYCENQALKLSHGSRYFPLFYIDACANRKLKGEFTVNFMGLSIRYYT
jgi:hypothetical protein